MVSARRQRHARPVTKTVTHNATAEMESATMERPVQVVALIVVRVVVTESVIMVKHAGRAIKIARVSAIAVMASAIMVRPV